VPNRALAFVTALFASCRSAPATVHQGPDAAETPTDRSPPAQGADAAPTDRPPPSQRADAAPTNRPPPGQRADAAPTDRPPPGQGSDAIGAPADRLPPGWNADAIVAEATRFDASRRAAILAWRIEEDDRPWRVERALVWVELFGPQAPQKRFGLMAFARTPNEGPPSRAPTGWRLPQHHHGEPIAIEWYAGPPDASQVDRFLAGIWRDFSFKAPSNGFKTLDAAVCRRAWRTHLGQVPPPRFEP
jgi:hypothetical protein